MAKQEKENEVDRFAGCYGERVKPSALNQFLLDCFLANEKAAKVGAPRMSACIWGNAGIGKTDIVKQLKVKKIVWNDKNYDGYRVIAVPLAQFEEMGDIHGVPDVFMLVRNEKDERWVCHRLIDQWKKAGYEVVHDAGVRTMNAPPDWVPQTPGPTIFLMDDWNRASGRIIKGIMQLLQDYATVSWSLPAGTNIVLTANPDQQDYLVTSLDSAILTRIQSITLVEDAKEWAMWASGHGVDSRVIAYVLKYPEMMIGHERTNPRTIAQFGRIITEIPVLNDLTVDRFNIQAKSLLDDETVSSLTTFFDRELQLVIEPEDILSGKPSVMEDIHKLMTQKERRTDIVGVTTERLYAYMMQKDCEVTPARVKNFQTFITSPDLPEDMRYSVCRRIHLFDDPTKKNLQWLIGNVKLKELILTLFRSGN